LAFVAIDPMNARTKFEVRSFTRSSVNRGYVLSPQNGVVPGYAHAAFSPKFDGLGSDGPFECAGQIWSR